MILILRPPHRATRSSLRAALSWARKAINTGHFPELDAIEFEDVAADLIMALDTADEVTEKMPREELELATQVLGQIFRKYLMELQSADGRTPFAPLP